MPLPPSRLKAVRPATLRSLALVAGAAACVGAGVARAQFRDEIGYTRLEAELGAAMPTGAGLAVSQVEAQLSYVNNVSYYTPDAAFGEFTGKTLTPKVTPSGVSWHATLVGQVFFGSASGGAPGITTIDCHEANDFASAVGLLRTGTLFAPRTETRAVENHSWIGTADNGGMQDVEILRRFDYAIQRDDFFAAVGVNNGAATPIPPLMASAYNVVSVGLPNGQHSTGTSTADGLGRVKPEIVAPNGPNGATSYATPVVAASAALLRQVAPAAGRHSVSLKAMLLAGATKDLFPNWNRTTTRPLDAHFGAGQVNIFNSYHILAAGQQPASASVSAKPRGWDYTTTAASGRTYFFDIPAGNTAPRFSVLLTWNRTLTNTWPNSTPTLANLSLKLYAATGFTKGALLDQSMSAIDNIEHLYAPSLAPGRYAIDVTGDINNVPYGLAWFSLPTVSIAATSPNATERNLLPGTFTISRGGELASALTVFLNVSGSATGGVDYTALPASVTIPANQSSVTLEVAPLADAQLEGDEPVTVSIASDFTYAFDTAGSATVMLRDEPSYDAWRMTYFTPAQQVDVEVSGELGDPNGNGLLNLMEYALNRNPTAAGGPGLPAAGLYANGFPTLTYTAPSGVSDVSYIVEVSTDFATWHSGPEYTAAPVVAADDGFTQTISVASLLPVSVQPQQYLRLRVTKP